MMKRTMTTVAAGLLAVVMMLGLVACGDSGSGVQLGRGQWSGDTYTNEGANITFKLPSGWTILSDEEYAANVQVSTDAMGTAGNAFTEAMQKAQVLYDTMAVAPPDAVGNTANIQIMFENLSVGGRSGWSIVQYLDKMNEDLATAAPMFTFTDSKTGTKTLGGESYTTYEHTEATYGFTQYMCIRKLDSYLICIMITAFSDADITNLLANFS